MLEAIVCDSCWPFIKKAGCVSFSFDMSRLLSCLSPADVRFVYFSSRPSGSDYSMKARGRASPLSRCGR